MLTTTHAVMGATAGAALKNPALSFVSGVILHFLADKIPHFWPKEHRHQELIKVLDSITSLGVVAYLYIVNPLGITGMAWGALGGIAVDFILVGIPFISQSRIGQWHTTRQPHKTSVYYLASDFLVMAASLTIMVSL